MVDEMVALGSEPVPTPADAKLGDLVVVDALGGELVEQPA